VRFGRQRIKKQIEKIGKPRAVENVMKVIKHNQIRFVCADNGQPRKKVFNKTGYLGFGNFDALIVL